MTVKELKNLPIRKWDNVTIYDQICIINSGKKHDSGWAWMMIIGLDNGIPIEIAAHCDHIQFENNVEPRVDLNIDMHYPSGVIRYHSCTHRFIVGHSLSSTTVKLIKL